MKSFNSKRIPKIMAVAVLIMFIVGLKIVVDYSLIVDKEAGYLWAQKIFYYHVPSAWTAFLANFIVMIAAIQFLRTRDRKWDQISLASAEIGTLFCLLVLITGPIWAQAAWGKPWTWEPRLLTTLILFLLYVGYFMLRQFGGHYERVARNSAVLGIIAFLDVPIVYLSLKFWSAEAQAHPQSVMSEQSSLVLNVFFFNLATFTLLFIYMLWYRVHVLSLKQKQIKMTYGL